MDDALERARCSFLRYLADSGGLLAAFLTAAATEL